MTKQILLENHPFSQKIQHWYIANKRDLPWRKSEDPYVIWLSEIILQQTRVAQGLPYFLKFIEKYPDINAFANAPIEEILRIWQGLGYYSRARNMHETAKIISKEKNGVFPSRYEELIKLKGIGEYTAAAIASFSKKEPVAVLDGNVYRVLARYFGLSDDISNSKSKKVFSKLANEVLSLSNPDIHNQAIMEFGALHCTPKAPSCLDCPLNDNCYAFSHHLTASLPFKSKKIKAEKVEIFYLVIFEDGKLWMKERKNEKNNIWKGLFDFLETEKIKFETIRLKKPSENYFNTEHVLTHRKLNLHFLIANPIDIEIVDLESGSFFDLKTIEKLPKPIVIDRYFQQELKAYFSEI